MSLELETFTIHTECLFLMATTKTGTTHGPTSSMATVRHVTAKGRRTGGRLVYRKAAYKEFQAGVLAW